MATKLMDIVMPIMLLGGAVLVISKRCEWLKMCGETGGDVIDGSTDDVVDTTAPDVTRPTSTTSRDSGCCQCQFQGEKVKCRRHGTGEWFNPPGGNDDSISGSLAECNKNCSGGGGGGSSSGGKNISGGNIRNASGGGSGGIQTRKDPRGATIRGKGLAPATSAPCKTGIKDANGNCRCKAGQRGVPGGCVASGYTQIRSYFVDPNYVRPFTLYHRIAN